MLDVAEKKKMKPSSVQDKIVNMQNKIGNEQKGFEVSQNRLRKRLEKGEIDRKEYDKKKKDIMGEYEDYQATRKRK